VTSFNDGSFSVFGANAICRYALIKAKNSLSKSKEFDRLLDLEEFQIRGISIEI